MSINNRVVPSNSAVAAERRAFFVLTDATDLITPEDITVTGVKVSLSLNGATPANSTNDIVKVSGATGLYYLELTQPEANQTPGAKYVGTLQPSGCARAFVAFEIGAAGAFAEPPTLNVSGGMVEANVQQINDATVIGDGTSGNLWRGA